VRGPRGTLVENHQHHFMDPGRHPRLQGVRLPRRVGWCRREDQMTREAAGSRLSALAEDLEPALRGQPYPSVWRVDRVAGERPQPGPPGSTGKVDGLADHPLETVRGGRQRASSETVSEVRQGHAEGNARSQPPLSQAECVVAQDPEDTLEATKEALNADTVGVEMGPVQSESYGSCETGKLGLSVALRRPVEPQAPFPRTGPPLRGRWTTSVCLSPPLGPRSWSRAMLSVVRHGPRRISETGRCLFRDPPDIFAYLERYHAVRSLSVPKVRMPSADVPSSLSRPFLSPPSCPTL
jgi:hypothetical protein